MGFWIYMLVISLFIPAAMLGFGILFFKKAPKNINFVFGFRTPLSMKNRQTWEFAHKLCGKIWIVCGGVLLIAAVVAMLFCRGGETGYVGTFGLIVEIVELVVLIVSVIPTVVALRRSFDRHGRRIK
ncbi:MAG: SdpI family protein [Oscillospiraceae bacterium]|nr:SdpI family protein [Oscillospiraceae bacterium]